jgi:hypothetical protein
MEYLGGTGLRPRLFILAGILNAKNTSLFAELINNLINYGT